MKTVIIILFVVLIGFGFLLSANLHMQNDLEQIVIEQARSENENQQLRDRLSAQSQEIDQASQQLEQMTLEKQVAEATIQTVTIEKQQLIIALANANAQLFRSVTEVNVLRQQVSNLQSNNEYLMVENINLKGTLDSQLPAENQIVEALIPVTGLVGNSKVKIIPMLLLLGLPISIMLTRVVNHRIMRHQSRSRNTGGRLMIQLTEEEKELIIRMRRNK